MLLVQNGMQQIVSVDNAFHQDVGFTVAYSLHGPSGCGIRIIFWQDVHILRIIFQCGIML